MDQTAIDEDREAPAYVMWKTKEGTVMRVVDMDDKHLFNSIRMLERNALRTAAELVEARNTVADFGDFDGATGLPSYTASDVLRNHRCYGMMVAMAVSRGIDLTYSQDKAKFASTTLSSILKEVVRGVR